MAKSKLGSRNIDRKLACGMVWVPMPCLGVLNLAKSKLGSRNLDRKLVVGVLNLTKSKLGSRNLDRKLACGMVWGPKLAFSFSFSCLALPGCPKFG